MTGEKTSDVQEVPTHIDPSGTFEPTKEFLILKAFVMNFNELFVAMVPHVDYLPKKLLGSQLISKESCDHLKSLQRLKIEANQRTIVVLGLLQLSITTDCHCLRQLVRVLKEFSPLMHTAEVLSSTYSKSDRTLWLG